MKPSTPSQTEADSTYFLKLVLFFLIGAIWLDTTVIGLPLPIGFALGLIFARHDHFQIDRKIEYAVLLVAMIVSFVAPIGLVIDITDV